ncbi:DUF5994 family protein [Geodermatophilus sabuli]|uniref:Uncharacterized protein n=1 Tax=Geodermatophilus sabuli TaxID=1564158 RepID=A0A285EHJ6_9ACTN|nr:DUF5994 family protein [Geodermatophilus sabuli]MBB3083906.1 hypothetical protein [Geodermatophilus sabuli]SNX98555.1 hypothetical protein SAMN06893097_11169 [Geodermatophilus sabuli]
MTTIRVTRVDRTAPAAPAPPVTAGAPLRLALLDGPGDHTTLDGGWWPRSRSLADELPGLLTDLQRRGIRVSRVTFNPQSWDAAPRRLTVGGRTVRLGWFRGLDPHLVNLSGGDDGRDRLDLLVVPPDTADAVAARALSAASAPGNHGGPTAVLDGVEEGRPGT